MSTQSIAGLNVGEDKVLEAIVMLAGVGLVAVNAYHMATFLAAKLSSAESSLIWVGILYTLGCSLALLEIPVARMLVTQYRLAPYSFATVILGAIACIVVSLAVVAGISSQSHSGHERENDLVTHTMSGASLESGKAAIESNYQLALVRAKMINNESSREYAIVKATANRDAELSVLAGKVYENQKAKPSEMNQDSPLVKKAVSILFALVCSVGAMVLSAYHTIYVMPLIALPALSLISKKDHEWNSDKTNFQSANHIISPLKNEVGTLPIGEGFKTVKATKTTDSEISVSNTETYSPATSDTDNTPSGRSLSTSTSGDSFSASYELVRGLILDGTCKPTLRGVKAVLVKSNIKFVTDKARTEAITQILDLLHKEGVLILNPKHGVTGKVVAKYLLNDKQKAGEAHDISGVVGITDIVCICPECRAEEVIDNISKSGKVRSGCGHVYDVARNLKNSEQMLLASGELIGIGVVLVHGDVVGTVRAIRNNNASITIDGKNYKFSLNKLNEEGWRVK
jgi:hypothetical protein